MKKFLRKLGLVMITAGIIGSLVAGSWLAFQDGFLTGLLVSSILGTVVGLILYEVDIKD